MIHHRDARAILFLFAWPFIYFWPVTLAQRVWFTRDISRMYYPTTLELARALGEGRLPLWVPKLQAGFPLVAEGQVAAFYPPHVLLVKLLPPEFAISYGVLLHLAWAAVGMYACVRGIGFSRAAALLAGFLVSFNGYMIQKLYHPDILLTAAWLPWLIFFQDQFQRARRGRDSKAGVWFLLLTLAAGVQWFIGTPQIALLNSMTTAVFGFFGGLFWNHEQVSFRKRLNAIPRVAFWTLLPLLLSGGIAAIQLVPTTELIGYSVRAKGLSERVLTYYSLPFTALAQFVFPFAPGEPSDDNVELWGYIGLTTLVWASVAIGLRRDALTIFCLAFSLVALSLALGSQNPAYQALIRLPIFNFFRVPARYLQLFGFAAIFLCAITFEELARRAAASVSNRRAVMVAGVFALATLGVIALAYTQGLDFWLHAWQVLPWILGLFAVILLALAWTRRIERNVLGAAMIGLVVLDLSANAATFLSTKVAEITPPSFVNSVPRSVQVLGIPHAPERVFTDETVWPSIQSQRSSLFPNFGWVYGREMAHGYNALLFDTLETYYYTLSPAMLNLLNVRYFAIPLEPRFIDRSPTPYATLALDVVENEVVIPPTAAVAIQVNSFTEDTSDIPDGSVVAELAVKFDNGRVQTIPLRLGIETADWDYGLKSKSGAPPSRARIAHTVPAFLRSASRLFEGYVYQARFDLASSEPTHRVVAVEVRPLTVPASRLSIERVSLIDERGTSVSVAALSGKDDFALKYMSDTAAIWENLNALPRAFLVHRAEVVNGDQMFDELHRLGFPADQIALLDEGQPLTVSANADLTQDYVEITRYQPEYVSLSVTTNAPGYLLLTDNLYPGWNVFVDGKPSPIYRADFLFRAVLIDPGQHTVEFQFRPMSLWIGAAISLATLVVLGGAVIFMRRRW